MNIFAPRTIGRYSDSRDNNLNLLRFLAAFAVVWSHAALVAYGDMAIEPLVLETGYTLGHLAVNVFFVISGFLIAQSLQRSKDLVEYFSARFLRLVPGLFVAAMVTAFIIGPLLSDLGIAGYFSQLATWAYVPLTSSMLIDNGELPGVFANVPSAHELNGSLWTLRWEALAYIGLAILGSVGLLTTKLRYGLFFGLFLALYIGVTLWSDLRDTIAPIDHVFRFGLCFLLGTFAFVYREKIPLSIFIGLPLATLPVLLRDTGLYQLALVTAIGYAMLWLAFIPKGNLRKFNNWGDFSYGIYIYGYPVKQVLITVLPQLDALALMAIASPIILTLAIASYYLVERPAMRQRFLVADRVRNWLMRIRHNRLAPSPAE